MSDLWRYDYHSRGDPSASHSMHSYVLRAKECNYDPAEDVWGAVIQLLDKIYDNTDVPGAYGEFYDTEHALACNDWLNDTHNYLDNHSELDHDGTYLWVTNCTNSNGNLGASESWNAWEQQIAAYVSTQTSGTGELQGVGIQEICHGFINEDCQYVEPLIDGYENEHVLGQINNMSNNDSISPMVATYEDDWVVSEGDCNRDTSYNNHTNVLTWCTVDAVEYSKDQAYWNGVH